MKNDIDLFCNGNTIYATLKIRSNRIKSSVFIGFVAMCVIGLVYKFLSNFPNLTKSIFITILLLLISIIVLLVSVMWYVRGREYLIINTKSIRYQRDYGIHISHVKTKYFNKAVASIEITEERKECVLGVLHIYASAGQSKKKKDLYSSKITLEVNKLQMLCNLIDEIYFNEFIQEKGYVEISLN